MSGTRRGGAGRGGAEWDAARQGGAGRGGVGRGGAEWGAARGAECLEER